MKRYTFEDIEKTSTSAFMKSTFDNELISSHISNKRQNLFLEDENMVSKCKK